MWVPHHHTGPGSVPRLWKEAHRSINTRRDFLSVAFKGSAMAAATALLSGSDPALAGSVSGRSVNRMEDAINNGSTRHYKPPFRFGMGGSHWEMNSQWLPIMTHTPLYKDSACELGISVAAFKNRLRRGRSMLSRTLGMSPVWKATIGGARSKRGRDCDRPQVRLCFMRPACDRSRN
jgi:hypothetical protein